MSNEGVLKLILLTVRSSMMFKIKVISDSFLPSQGITELDHLAIGVGYCRACIAYNFGDME